MSGSASHLWRPPWWPSHHFVNVSMSSFFSSAIKLPQNFPWRDILVLRILPRLLASSISWLHIPHIKNTFPPFAVLHFIPFFIRTSLCLLHPSTFTPPPPLVSFPSLFLFTPSLPLSSSLLTLPHPFSLSPLSPFPSSVCAPLLPPPHLSHQ